jgi:hypothetical protein
VRGPNLGGFTDRLRLNGGVEKLIEKKSFVHDDLLSEIRSTLATHHS